MKRDLTPYQKLSSMQLYAMYRQETWNGLTESQKLGVLQETVNREAAQHGNVYSAEVSFASMPQHISGYEDNGKITINYDLAVSGEYSYKNGNDTIQFTIPDSGYRTMECLLHEHQHVVQENILNGNIKADEDVRAALEANAPSLSVVDGQLGNQYLSGKNDYALYYMQPMELDAYMVSQNKTAAIISNLKEMYGSDAAMEAYGKRMETEGWQARLQYYNHLFGNENTPEQITKALMNVYNHENTNVQQNIEAAVKAEMIASANQNTNELKEDTMSNQTFQPTAVTREQFEATLHDSVNNYYQHALNDPQLSHEEALEETSQMAEQYYDAVAEFDTAEAEAAPSVSDGADISEGCDVGDAGGVSM